MFAIALTFNACSSGDDNNDGGNAPSGGITNGTGSFSGSGAGEKAQAYEEYWDNEADETATKKYTGNGDIQIESCDEYGRNCEYIDAGKIEGGMVKLQLPSTIAPKYLTAIDPKDFHSSCNAPTNLKSLDAEFSIDDDRYMSFKYTQYDDNSQVREYVSYVYLSGPLNMNCSYEEDIEVGDCVDDRCTITVVGKTTVSFNFNFSQGWNEMYSMQSCSRNNGKTNCDIKRSTNKNILKHLNDMKWLINR
jgi:hypothetical protein